MKMTQPFDSILRTISILRTLGRETQLLAGKKHLCCCRPSAAMPHIAGRRDRWTPSGPYRPTECVRLPILGAPVESYEKCPHQTYPMRSSALGRPPWRSLLRPADSPCQAFGYRVGSRCSDSRHTIEAHPCVCKFGAHTRFVRTAASLIRHNPCNTPRVQIRSFSCNPAMSLRFEKWRCFQPCTQRGS